MKGDYSNYIEHIEVPKVGCDIDLIQKILNSVEIGNKSYLVLELHYIRQLFACAKKVQSTGKQQFELFNIEQKLKTLKLTLKL